MRIGHRVGRRRSRRDIPSTSTESCVVDRCSSRTVVPLAALCLVVLQLDICGTVFNPVRGQFRVWTLMNDRRRENNRKLVEGERQSHDDSNSAFDDRPTQRRGLWERLRSLLGYSDAEIRQIIFERHSNPPPNRNLTKMPTRAPTLPPAGSFAPTPRGTTPTGPPSTSGPTPTPGPPTTSVPTPTPGPPTTVVPTLPAPTPTPGPPTTPAPSPSSGLTVEQYLTLTLTQGGEIQVPGTAQNEAYLSLIANFPDLDPNNPADQLPLKQTYALNTLYFSTNGTNWLDSLDWTGPAPVCGWFGVSCNLTEVFNLTLPDNDLQGTLTSEIRGLEKLGTNTSCEHRASP